MFANFPDRCTGVVLFGQQLILGTTVTMMIGRGPKNDDDDKEGGVQRKCEWLQTEVSSMAGTSLSLLLLLHTVSVCSSGTSLSFPEAESNAVQVVLRIICNVVKCDQVQCSARLS